jgi:hypothetical protein
MWWPPFNFSFPLRRVISREKQGIVRMSKAFVPQTSEKSLPSHVGE